jgi:ATP-dependent DNA helicase Rep (EC 3.6.1.-)
MLLKEDYPSLKIVMLEQNYRSTSRILRCANVLIANNPHASKSSCGARWAWATRSA